MNVIDSSHTSNTALLISILLLGVFIFIGSFLYYIVYRTSKIDSHITDINKSTLSTTLSFALDSQNYSVKIDNLDGNHNIGDIIPIWIRLQNPNVVFLNQQYNTNIYVSMFIGGFLILSTLIYMGYSTSKKSPLLEESNFQSQTPSSSPYGLMSSEATGSPTNMYNKQKNLDDKIQNHKDVYINFNKLSSQKYLF